MSKVIKLPWLHYVVATGSWCLRRESFPLHMLCAETLEQYFNIPAGTKSLRLCLSGTKPRGSSYFVRRNGMSGTSLRVDITCWEDGVPYLQREQLFWELLSTLDRAGVGAFWCGWVWLEVSDAIKSN